MIKKQDMEDNGLEYIENAIDKSKSGFAKNYMYKEEITEEGHTKTFNLYTDDYSASKKSSRREDKLSKSSLSNNSLNENNNVSISKKGKKSLLQIIISFFKSLFGVK